MMIWRLYREIIRLIESSPSQRIHLEDPKLKELFDSTPSAVLESTLFSCESFQEWINSRLEFQIYNAFLQVCIWMDKSSAKCFSIFLRFGLYVFKFVQLVLG